MSPTRQFFSVLLLFSFACAATCIRLVRVDADGVATDEETLLFNRAFSRFESGYVLVIIVDKRTQHKMYSCLEAGLLTNCTRVEYDLPRSEDGFNKVFDKVARSEDPRLTNHSFSFARPNVLDVVKPTYDQETLDRIREELNCFSRRELIKSFRLSSEGGYVARFRRAHPGAVRHVPDPLSNYRACAHVLLERKILPRGCCRGGPDLYVDPHEQIPE